MGKVTFGTISAGTLITHELLERFADALEDIARSDDEHGNLSDKQVTILEEARAYSLVGFEDGLNDDGAASASELVGTLCDMLGEYAPAYGYFGAHEGDGADFFELWTRADPDVPILQRAKAEYARL